MAMNEQAGDPASGAASAPDGKAKAIVKRCCKRRQQKLSRLQALAKTNPRKAKRHSRRYFASKSVRIAGAYDAWRSLAPKPIADQVIPYDEIVQAGLALDMWNASEEPVFLRPKERLNGRMRYFPILQLREKARDRIAYDVAKVVAELHPNQFMTRGPAHLHAWLDQHLPKGAKVITTDIPSCHDTIRRSSVMRDVPLPGHVLKAVLMDTKERAVHLVKEPKGGSKVLVPSSGDHTSPFVDAGPSCRGILTGAALAIYASELVIKNILVAAESAAPGVHAAAWGDNLIIILEDASVAALVYAAVEHAVATNFGMDVLDGLAHRKQETALPGAFHYCGQWYQMKSGKLVRRVDVNRSGAAMLKIGTMISEMKTKDDLDKIKRTMFGYLLAIRHDTKTMKEYLEDVFSYGEANVSEIAAALIATEKIV